MFDHLVAEGAASIEALSQRFAVSRMTIHRDLDEMEGEGLLRRVRGGASVEASGQFESDVRYRSHVALEEKRAIARTAAGFVEPGMSVMVDDGSTGRCLAPFLAERVPLTVITNNMGLIGDLAPVPRLRLLSLGGTYSQRFDGFFGVVTEAALGTLRADIAILSSSAIEGRTAFHQDQEVLAVKQRMHGAARRRVLMAHHQKFGRTALHLWTDLSTFDALVTSNALVPAALGALRDEGIAVHVADLGP
nr:DeoR/GlpR family DNA-binding transcription regulator [Aureimonas sp. AU4]